MADVLRSAMLKEAGFAHAFALRSGGVSDPPFSSLNLGRAIGDDEEAVWENHIRFAMALPCGRGGLFEVSQVHGTSARLVDAGEDPVAVRQEEHDALIAPPGGVAVGVRTADCVPILVADVASGAVAAIHAGWRGAVAGIVPRTLERMRAEFGTDPVDYLAVIGPHIRVRDFEVGEEVAEAALEALRELPPAAGAETAAAAVVRRDLGPKPHVDLAALVSRQLVSHGVWGVDDVGGCTLSEPKRFFSHRRDAGRTGRHVSAIVSR